jgi:hypothetical protein
MPKPSLVYHMNFMNFVNYLLLEARLLVTDFLHRSSATHNTHNTQHTFYSPVRTLSLSRLVVNLVFC